MYGIVTAERAARAARFASRPPPRLRRVDRACWSSMGTRPPAAIYKYRQAPGLRLINLRRRLVPARHFGPKGLDSRGRRVGSGLLSHSHVRLIDCYRLKLDHDPGSSVAHFRHIRRRTALERNHFLRSVAQDLEALGS